MHLALLEINKPNEFLVDEITAIVIHNGNADNITETEDLREQTEKINVETEAIRGQTGKIREETENRKETEMTEECKITDLMSIPTVEENDSDLELSEETSTTDLQEEISQLISPIIL